MCLKALIIGYGSIGKRHISNLTKIKNIEIIVLTKRPVDSFLKKNRCKVFKTIKDSISEKPTFAIISNETYLHMKYTVILAKSGIHLFIEKPLSHSMNGIDTLLSVSKNKKLTTQIGCNLRFHPCIKKIKEILLSKKLGKILSIQIENGSYLPDWHPNEDYSKNYASQQKMGGGVILTCIHEIDYLYWLFGKITDVFSFSQKLSDLKINCEDLSSILMKVGNGTIAEIHLDYFQRPPVRRGKIIGTLGTIIWNIGDNGVMLYNAKTKKWTDLLKLKKYDYNQMYVEEMSHFIKCVKTNTSTINPLSDGIQTLKIALSIKHSSKLKKVIKV